MEGSLDVGKVKVIAFDAYGTLYNFSSAIQRHKEQLGDKADALDKLWRGKQLEYTWLRSLTNQYLPFW